MLVSLDRLERNITAQKWTAIRVTVIYKRVAFVGSVTPTRNRQPGTRRMQIKIERLPAVIRKGSDQNMQEN
jgi:hypothetical protein